jgi:hypothetical protein
MNLKILGLNVWPVFISLRIQARCKLCKHSTETAGFINSEEFLQHLSEYIFSRSLCTTKIGIIVKTMRKILKNPIEVV